MTNKELIVKLLDSDLNAETNLIKTIGNIAFKPEVKSRWIKAEGHTMQCEHCGCRVSNRACLKMNYCFSCGALMGEPYYKNRYWGDDEE